MAEAVVRANAVQNCADGISWMSRGRTPNGLPLDQIPIRQRAALSLLAGSCHRAGPIDATPLQTPATEHPIMALRAYGSRGVASMGPTQ